MFEAGASQVEITPSTPQWLDGYGNRTAPSEGAYLPIWARGLALRAGGEAALLVAAEVLGFDRSRVPQLKRRIAERTGIPAEGVILAATHTHCAPRVCEMVMPGSIDPSYVAWFEERCVEAAARAWEALAPAALSLSHTRDTVGINRRVLTESGVVMRPNPDGPHDRQVDTLWFEDPDSAQVRASLTIAGCHPTCRGGQSIGGDYPGFLCRELERATEGVALFGLGCAGDVRPHFTNAEGRFRAAEPEEVEQAGKRLALGVLSGREAREPALVEAVRVARKVAAMPLAELPGEGELRRTTEEDGNPLRREWARQMLAADRNVLPRTIEFECQILGLLPTLALVFWPGEVAADYGLWARGLAGAEGSPGRIAAVAYANGTVGYVSSKAMFPLGGYEVNGSHPYYNLPAPYVPDIEDRLQGLTLDLMHALTYGTTSRTSD